MSRDYNWYSAPPLQLQLELGKKKKKKKKPIIDVTTGEVKPASSSSGGSEQQAPPPPPVPSNVGEGTLATTNAEPVQQEGRARTNNKPATNN